MRKGSDMALTARRIDLSIQIFEKSNSAKIRKFVTRGYPRFEHSRLPFYFCQCGSNLLASREGIS